MLPEEIEAIKAQGNLILRNLNVTQAYHLLSEGMKGVTGEENTSWVTFATYASKTAGQSIRSEILPEEMARAFRSFRVYQRLLAFMRRFLSDESERQGNLNLVQKILARISLRVSDGNIMVFSELAPLFSGMIDLFSGEVGPDESKLNDFLAHFQPGPSTEGGQDALIEAFTAYYQAKFERERDRRMELIFLGNLLVGYHEQQRLQPVIAESIYAPVDEVLGRPFPFYIPLLGKRINNWIHNAYLAFSRWVFAGIATRFFMAIYLPTGSLKLGFDVPAPAGGQTFPPELEFIDLPRAAELLGQLDRTSNSLFGSRAGNWANLEDRMNFIVDFFRSHQQNPALFEPPFLPEQEEAMRAGRVPGGKL